MRTLIALVCVVALVGCSKKKEAPTEEPVVTKPTETGSAMATGSGSAATPGSGSAAAPGSGSGSAAPAPTSDAVKLADGFSWTPPEKAFTNADEAAVNPVAWKVGDKTVQVGLGFGVVEKNGTFPVQVVVVDGGAADVKKTLPLEAPGEAGTFRLAPYGKDRFYVEVNLSFSDAAGTHAVLGAVLASTAKGIDVENSATWEEIDDANNKIPDWATAARKALGSE